MPKFPPAWGWINDAACRLEDPELFFAELGEDTSRKIAAAKDVCVRCPVLAACRELADRIEHRSTDRTRIFGVWGGETPNERAARRRRENGEHLARRGGAA